MWSGCSLGSGLFKNSSSILLSTKLKVTALAANWDLNLQDVSCVAALLSLFLSLRFPRQTLPLNAPVGRSFFQSCYLASEPDSSHNSAQQQPHEMAETCTESFPTTQDTEFMSPLSFLQSPLIPCITESKEDRGRKKKMQSKEAREKRQEKGTV